MFWLHCFYKLCTPLLVLLPEQPMGGNNAEKIWKEGTAAEQLSCRWIIDKDINRCKQSTDANGMRGSTQQKQLELCTRHLSLPLGRCLVICKATSFLTIRTVLKAFNSLLTNKGTIINTLFKAKFKPKIKAKHANFQSVLLRYFNKYKIQWPSAIRLIYSISAPAVLCFLRVSCVMSWIH